MRGGSMLLKLLAPTVQSHSTTAEEARKIGRRRGPTALGHIFIVAPGCQSQSTGLHTTAVTYRFRPRSVGKEGRICRMEAREYVVQRSAWASLQYRTLGIAPALWMADGIRSQERW